MSYRRPSSMHPRVRLVVVAAHGVGRGRDARREYRAAFTTRRRCLSRPSPRARVASFRRISFIHPFIHSFIHSESERTTDDDGRRGRGRRVLLVEGSRRNTGARRGVDEREWDGNGGWKRRRARVRVSRGGFETGDARGTSGRRGGRATSRGAIGSARGRPGSGREGCEDV